jgi:hypothetical protein
MPPVDEVNVAAYPVDVGLFGSQGVTTYTHIAAKLLQEGAGHLNLLVQFELKRCELVL